MISLQLKNQKSVSSSLKNFNSLFFEGSAKDFSSFHFEMRKLNIFCNDKVSFFALDEEEFIFAFPFPPFKKRESSTFSFGSHDAAVDAVCICEEKLYKMKFNFATFLRLISSHFLLTFCWSILESSLWINLSNCIAHSHVSLFFFSSHHITSLSVALYMQQKRLTSCLQRKLFRYMLKFF